MPLTSMARIAAGRAVPGAQPRDTPKPPAANDLLKTIGAYIPTDVTAFYVPIAAGMVAAEASDATRHIVAIAVAVLAAFTAWVVAHRVAVAAAKAAGKPPPSAGTTAKAGWFEIVVAGVALYIWALAIPGSWVHFGKGELFLPALIVGGASLIIGGVATLLNRRD
jgi:hypothetical protein